MWTRKRPSNKESSSRPLQPVHPKVRQPWGGMLNGSRTLGEKKLKIWFQGVGGGGMEVANGE